MIILILMIIIMILIVPIQLLQVAAAFTKFDQSGDKKLDYREFCEMIHSNDD